ncbi:phosphoenolpyruvate--protein phosphotransferase [Elusimicrobiota bacterium]
MAKNNKNITIRGVAASSGIAIGKVFLLEDDEFCLIQRQISKHEIRAELSRFKEAITKTRMQMLTTKEKMVKSLGKAYSRLGDAYLLILDDPIISREAVKKIHEGINAEYALFKVIEKVSHSFDMIEDEYFKERKHDVQDVGKKILRNLLGKDRRSLAEIKSDSIVVAHNLAPSDTVLMRDHLVSGFATDIGGRTSHTAIVAQGLEIPAVVGMRNITSYVSEGETIILDGDNGIVIINPTSDTINDYKKQQKKQAEQIRELEKLKDLPAETTDGQKVVIASNIDDPSEIKSVVNHGAEGIGLYRTEFLYFNRTGLPTEEEHYRHYVDVAKKVSPHSVIVRTMDIGGDKVASLGLEGVTSEVNPFMGLRAIRLCLKYPSIFKTQLRAILRASAEENIKIMYPMISGVGELREANKILDEAKQELKREKIKFDENIKVGVMIEVPSAALTADIIAKEVDFLSIGTNDLIQYTLAVDRVNENVASLYQPVHLSVLRLLKSIIIAGHNAGRWVGMCGEMAGDPCFTMILAGLGLDEFSVSPAQVPKIKKIIRSISWDEAKKLSGEILDAKDTDAVIEKIRVCEQKGIMPKIN